jgi:hypothetical protein
LHALTPAETAGVVIGSVVGGAGLIVGALALAGVFDREHYSDTELTAYLTVLATTRDIENNRNSDNKARDVVRRWRAGASASASAAPSTNASASAPAASFNIDNGFSTRGGSLTGVELKRLLIREMLSGVTAGEDEEGILTILENSTTTDLIALLDPTQGVSIQNIDSKVNGDNHARFEQLLERRLPRTGPNAAAQRQNTGPTCTARQSLLTDYARRRAVDEVQNAIDILTNRTGEDAVRRALACRFPGANAAQLNEVRAVFERTLAALPTRIYHCAPEGAEGEMGTLVVTDSTGQQYNIDCISEYARTYGQNAGTPQATTIAEVFLCPEFFRQPPDGQVLTIIHESVHAAGLLIDTTYNPGCGLALSVALTNPDSYAHFAHEVMSIPRQAQPTAQPAPVQRKAESEESPDELPEVVEDVVHSPGQPLDAITRERLEPRFNRDFGHVRVHTDSAAAQSARAVNAHAYTLGQDVVFGAGQYEPGTEKGTRLLAHELTHVVQQSGSGPTATQTAKPISDPDDAAEVEADSVAEQVLSGDNAVEVNQSPSAAVHAQLSSEAVGGLVAGGIALGGVAAGFIIAAAIGAFDTSRFRNCSQTQQDVVNSATDTAKRWIDNAVMQVDAVLANPEQAGQVVVNQLFSHFKIRPDDREHLGRLRQGLGQIQTGFSELLFECDSSCEENDTTAVAARVPGLLGGITLRYGRIHVCPRFFRGPQNPEDRRADEQPETIAHEMAHRFVGARGDVYRVVNMREYYNLTTEQALENADSYSQFARVLFNIGSSSSGGDSGTEATPQSAPESTPQTAPVQRKAIGPGGPRITPVRRKLQRQPAPESAPTQAAEPESITTPAPPMKEEIKSQTGSIPIQTGGIPKLDPTSGMSGRPAPPGCVDFLWAREYERIFRLDTISVVGLSGRPASEKPTDVQATKAVNEAFQSDLSESCMNYVNVKHPFRVRFYYLDTDLRNDVGEKVNSEDANHNRRLGNKLGAEQAARYRIYVERDLVAQETYVDAKTITEKVKAMIEHHARSSARRGATTGLIVGSILGGLTAIGVGLGAGAAVSKAGGSTGEILGFGALAGAVAGGAVLGLTTGIGALIGYARGTDRGTKELTKERKKEVKAFVDVLKKAGEVKGDKLTNSDADNLARDAVTYWIDSPAELPLTIKDRRLLIKVMMDGPTLDDDERAIIRLIENCTDAEVLQLLDPTVSEKERVTLQMLDSEIHGEEWKETRQMLQARFPMLGQPGIERTRTQTDPPCEADHAIMILAARKRATEIVPIALQRVNDYLADPAKQQAVLSKVNCYFPQAQKADVERIKTMYEQIQTLIPSSRYVCPGKEVLTVPTPPGPRTIECTSGDVAQTLPWRDEKTQVIHATNETYLCPLFFEQGPIYQATTLIHEWVHRVIPESETDKYDPKCDGMKLATALENPDSYALLARDLAEGRVGAVAAQPAVTIGNFRNSGAVTAENRCVSCPQIPSLGIDPAHGANFMEVRGDISEHRPDALYDFKRTKEVAIWMRIKGAWESKEYSAPGTLDDASWDDEDVVPKDNRIYSIDGPGGHMPIPMAVPPAIEGGVYKGNFVESVNVKVGDGPWTQSSNLFEWHSMTTFERGADGIMRRTPKNNEIEPGHIPIGSAPPGP